MKPFIMVLLSMSLGATFCQAQVTALNSGPAYRSTENYSAYVFSLRSHSLNSLNLQLVSLRAQGVAACAAAGVIAGVTVVTEVVPVFSLVGNLGTDLMLNTRRPALDYLLDTVGALAGPIADAVEALRHDDHEPQWRQTRARLRFTERTIQAGFGERSSCLEFNAKIEAIEREIALRQSPRNVSRQVADSPAPRDVPITGTPITMNPRADAQPIGQPVARHRATRRPAIHNRTAPSVPAVNDSGVTAPIPAPPPPSAPVPAITEVAGQTVQTVEREMTRVLDGLQSASSDDAGQ